MENTTIVNNTQTAQLRNVISLLTGIERAENRPPHLPGLVCFYGPRIDTAGNSPFVPTTLTLSSQAN